MLLRNPFPLAFLLHAPAQDAFANCVTFVCNDQSPKKMVNKLVEKMVKQIGRKIGQKTLSIGQKDAQGSVSPLRVRIKRVLALRTRFASVFGGSVMRWTEVLFFWAGGRSRACRSSSAVAVRWRGARCGPTGSGAGGRGDP